MLLTHYTLETVIKPERKKESYNNIYIETVAQLRVFFFSCGTLVSSNIDLSIIACLIKCLHVDVVLTSCI